MEAEISDVPEPAARHAVWAGWIKALLGIQGARFVMVGVLNTIVGYGIYYLIIWIWGKPFYLWAGAAGHVVGTIQSYLCNRVWTFRSSASPYWEMVKFVIVSSGQLGATLALNWLLVDFFGMSPYASPVIIIPVVTVTTYLAHKVWSFRAPG